MNLLCIIGLHKWFYFESEEPTFSFINKTQFKVHCRVEFCEHCWAVRWRQINLSELEIEK